MTRFGTIVGTGRYLPEVEVSNEAMKERLSQVNPALAGVVNNFQESTGIRRRWLCAARVGGVGHCRARGAGHAGRGRHHARAA